MLSAQGIDLDTDDYSARELDNELEQVGTPSKDFAMRW